MRPALRSPDGLESRGWTHGTYLSTHAQEFKMPPQKKSSTGSAPGKSANQKVQDARLVDPPLVNEIPFTGWYVIGFLVLLMPLQLIAWW